MHASFWRLVVLVAVVVGVPVTAAAATLRVPQDHRSIQSAIDAAQHGDTVLVAAGIAWIGDSFFFMWLEVAAAFRTAAVCTTRPW